MFLLIFGRFRNDTNITLTEDGCSKKDNMWDILKPRNFMIEIF